VGRHPAPDDAATERGDRHEARVKRVRARGAGRQHQLERVRPADEAFERALDGIGIVLDVLDRLDRRAQALDLGVYAGLEPRARGRPDRLLDDDPDPARDERRDPHQRTAAEVGQPRPGVDGRGVDDVRRDLDARHEVTGVDDLAIEDREHLERVDAVEPLEIPDPDVDHAGGGGQQVDAALRRPALGQPGAGHRSGQPEPGLVLVELAWLGDDDTDRFAWIGGREGRQVVGGQAPALLPARPGDDEVARQDRAREPGRRAPPWGDALDLHGERAGDGQSLVRD
jgi:hypothetical protein